jgi:hypothetical protein
MHVMVKSYYLTVAIILVITSKVWGASAIELMDVWVVEPYAARPILPDTILGIAPKDPILKITATPGEVESASFVIRFNDSVKGLELSASELKGNQGTISNETINIRFVKVWYQADGAWKNPRIRKRNKRILIPELLLKDADLVRVDHSKRANYIRLTNGAITTYTDISKPASFKNTINHPIEELPVNDSEILQPLNLQQNINQQVMLQVIVPEDTAPGNYTGELEMSKMGVSGRLRLPIVLTVLPFKLEASPLLYGIYYRGQLYTGQDSITSELKSKAQLYAELKNIYEHGIRYPIVFQGNANPTSKGMLNLLRSVSLLEDYMKVRGEIGFPTDHLFYLGVGTGGIAKDHLHAKSILNIASKHNFNTVYFYGRDEASGKKLRAQRQSWVTVRSLGGKIFAANNKHDIAQERMGDVLNVAIMARDLRPMEARSLRNDGVEKVLSYNNPQSAVENPYQHRKNYGFALWGADYDGAMLYAYQHALGSIWNDFDHIRFRDHCYTYPTKNGIIDTIAWEAIREAVDDIRYLATLNREFRLLTSTKHPEIESLRNEARSVEDTISKGDSWHPSKIRSRIIDIITKSIKIRQAG